MIALDLTEATAGDPQPLDVARIPDDQRAALTWRLRNMLARADRCAAAWTLPSLKEMARSESVRACVLELVVELEGGRPFGGRRS
jgi:hypothetical protein